MPKTSKFLFKTFQACFKRWEIPIQWWSAQEIYIPKVSTQSNNPLNVKGKLFFGLIFKCLETHFICNNKFINNSIQKGSMKKVAGCWEHLFMP